MEFWWSFCFHPSGGGADENRCRKPNHLFTLWPPPQGKRMERNVSWRPNHIFQKPTHHHPHFCLHPMGDPSNHPPSPKSTEISQPPPPSHTPQGRRHIARNRVESPENSAWLCLRQKHRHMWSAEWRLGGRDGWGRTLTAVWPRRAQGGDCVTTSVHSALPAGRWTSSRVGEGWLNASLVFYGPRALLMHLNVQLTPKCLEFFWAKYFEKKFLKK